MSKSKKILKIVILLFLSFVLLTQAVVANDTGDNLEIVEYSDAYKRWLELPEEEKSKTMKPRMYDIEATTEPTDNIVRKAKLLGASLTSSYSLKQDIPNNLSIRNQKNTLLCWAFSALSSLETNLALANFRKGITSTVYDYSESHMDYVLSNTFSNNKYGYNRAPKGGYVWEAAQAYLTNGQGAVAETDMPFENTQAPTSLSELQSKTIISQVYDTVEFPDYQAPANAEAKNEIMNQIKEHIKNYGSVFTGIHGDDFVEDTNTITRCYKNSTGAKYCKDSSHTANHAVSIIGWNDDYSKDNFAGDAKPSSNGAWIARNSWGEQQEYTVLEFKYKLFNDDKQYCINKGWNSAEEIPNDAIEQIATANEFTVDFENNKISRSVGDNGIIYISYEDYNVSKILYGIKKASDTVNYDNIYQYDEHHPELKIKLNGSNAMICNIFEKKTTGPEYLTQVSLYAPENYKCKVYVNPNGDSKSKNDMQLVQLEAGETETIDAGYHTLEFAKPVQITGNKFAVIIEIEDIDLDGKVEIASELKDSVDYISAQTETGKCFIATTNNIESCEWIDMSKLSQQGSNLKDGDSTIKAFTVSELNDGSLKNIEIVTPPTKTNYFEGENFDKTGMVVKANYHSKTNPSVTLNEGDYSITNGNNLTIGQTSVTITYEGESVNQPITVSKNSVINLTIKTHATTLEYKEGKNFDKTGMIVEATFADGTTREITDYEITDGYNLKANQTQVTISYGGKTVTEGITVTPNSLLSIAVTKAPTKTKYTVGENFDKTGMEITGTFEDGSTEEIKQYTIENGDNLQKGQTSVTIKYEGKTTQYSITVEEIKPENSNLDNVECSVSNVRYYTFTDSSKQEYLVMDVTVDKITKSNVYDSLEYYYYISSNKSESDIKDWVKITSVTQTNDKIQFTINTKDIKDYDKLDNLNNLYLYIKEIAIKGDNQSENVSKSMQINSNVTIETYRDNAKVEHSNSGNTGKSDGTTADNDLPDTGIEKIFIVFAVIIIAGGAFYIRYRNLSKYTK